MERKKFKKTEALLVTAVVSVVLTLVCLYLFSGFGGLTKAPLCIVEDGIKDIFGGALRNELWSLWAAQLSLTFLSISVLSVLSDKDHIIYWKDLVEERLLRPRFRCFAAYTYYSIAVAIVSFVGVIFHCATLFLLAFVINIAILILLTDSILDVYFSKEKHTQKMREQLRNAYKQAFQVEKAKRNSAVYDEIMDDLSTQIQRQKDDTQYMREIFELIYNNVELFDTTNTSVHEVMYSHFNIQNGILDLRPFEKVVSTAEGWAQQVKSGKTDTVYTADWLFWCAASETWLGTECFANIHSHSINIEPLLALEELLNRRLKALICCEQAMVSGKGDEPCTLSDESNANGWTKERYFNLVRALFGCYVAIYGKRLDRYYKECAANITPYDENVHKNFPKDKELLGQLTWVIQQYNDLQTYLYPYCRKVHERFTSLINEDLK